MMKWKTILFLSIFFVQARAQHNTVYSQYLFNALLINPAYAGSQDALNLTALYRNQWLGIDGNPRTITFSAHSPFANEKNNLGITFINDQFGISSHNKLNLVYAYRMKLKRGSLSLGLQGGVDFLKQDFNAVITTQRGDPLFTGSERKIIPEAGAGIYYHAPAFFIGVSAPELLSGTHLKTYFPVMVYTGAVIKVSEKFVIKPALLLKHISNSPPEADALATFYLGDYLGLGLGYRINDAALAFIDLRVNDQFRIGYAYDYTVSKLKNYSSGSHEIMLRYLFHYKVNSQSVRYF